MNEIVGEELPHMDETAIPMLVITNKRRVNGAVAMLYPDVLEQASRRLGGSFFILPSSIHEVLAVPEDTGSAEELAEMVASVNDTEVLPEDRLSYSVYRYDSARKKVLIACQAMA